MSKYKLTFKGLDNPIDWEQLYQKIIDFYKANFDVQEVTIAPVNSRNYIPHIVIRHSKNENSQIHSNFEFHKTSNEMIAMKFLNKDGHNTAYQIPWLAKELKFFDMNDIKLLGTQFQTQDVTDWWWMKDEV